MSKKFLTVRVWILIIALILSILSISPNPWAKGIEVKSVQEGSPEALAGLKAGETLLAINNAPVETISDFNQEINKLTFKEIKLVIETDKGTFSFNSTGIPSIVHNNLTIISAPEDSSLKEGMKILAINNIKINSAEDYNKVIKDLFPQETVIIRTNKGERAFLASKKPELSVSEVKKTNLNKGLELQGGTRVLLKPIADREVVEQDITNIIDVLNNRLNIYGLADLKIRGANDLAGNKLIVVEIAGATREEVRELIAKQGKFEAKVGNETAFVGGKGDIPYVCKDDGSCSGIRPPCNQVSQNQWTCTFQFAITLTDEAAQRHADITKNLEINITTGDRYLSKPLDLYLDDRLVDSLQIGADLKGQKTTQIAISGPGFSTTERGAYDDAIKNMNRLQTILITGSLPFKLEIEKLDTISPALGAEFIKNALFVGFLAIVLVSLIMFFRYKKVKIIGPIVVVMLSEVVLTLGVAALIQWNLDLASIAGIIAAVGTGVDDQIIITDETLRLGKQSMLSWKEKIKRAFFIIMATYATTIASLLPLWNAGAGLVRGFAVTTIIGVTIGVLITRPAYGSIIESLLED